MLLLILDVILFPSIQGDSLDFIYDNFYENRRKFSEQINVISDKDFYFPGESVSLFAEFKHRRLNDTTRSKWAYAFMFDSNNRILDHTRVFLNDEINDFNLQIPDSCQANQLYVSIFTAKNRPVLAKTVYLITGNENYFESDYLEKKNSIGTIETDRISNEVLPEAYFTTFVDGNKINIHINDTERKSTDNTLVICSGKEILWLSRISESKPKFQIPLGRNKSSYIICLMLNKNLDVVEKRILRNRFQKPTVQSLEKNDTLMLSIPQKFRKIPFLVKAVDADYQINRLTFDKKEVIELSFYGTIPNDMYFKNETEKMNWLNSSFEVNNEVFIENSKLVSNRSYYPIIYNLPSGTKLDDNLTINAVDIQGKIIDHELKGSKIIIDPNHFDSQESLLMLSAFYKKRKLRLTRDSTSVFIKLENYARNLLKGRKFSQGIALNDLKSYLTNVRQKNGVTILSEITITENRYKINYPGKGTTKTFEELEIQDEAYSALSLLTQISVYGHPHAVTGHIDAQKRWFAVDHANNYSGYTLPYPLYLNIPGYYSGYDFRVLDSYLAKWVFSITKVDKQPESVTVIIKPGFRGEENFIEYDKVFSQSHINQNEGVLLWNINSEGEKEEIRIPLKDFEGAVNWMLSFSNPDGTTSEYSGVYECTISE